MIEITEARPLSGAEPFSPRVAASAARRRCAHCQGPFGLIRRRRSGRQFCCAPCMDAHDEAIRRSVRAKARWLDLLDRARAARGR